MELIVFTCIAVSALGQLGYRGFILHGSFYCSQKYIIIFAQLAFSLSPTLQLSEIFSQPQFKYGICIAVCC